MGVIFIQEKTREQSLEMDVLAMNGMLYIFIWRPEKIFAAAYHRSNFYLWPG